MKQRPPIEHTCCGQGCFAEYEAEEDENYACWGKIKCIDSYLDDEGDEYRTGVCEGHSDCWPSYDKKKYVMWDKDE